jgi:acyl-CoA thioester hydrolase
MTEAPSASTPISPTDQAAYRHWTTDHARFGDTDRFGHVNNAVFATFCETGRVTVIHDPGRPLTPPGHIFVIAKLTLAFRAEMHWPGQVEIGTGLLRLGRTSFTLGQALYQAGACTATAESVLVLIDNITRRAAPLPEATRAILRDYAIGDAVAG